MKKNISVVLICGMLCTVNSFTGIAASRKQEPKKPLEQKISFEDKMQQLTASTQIWPALSRDEKVKAVGLIIDLFKVRENSAILKPADFYVTKIDDNSAKDSAMLKVPLPSVVKVMAVTEYDFYNGQDKDSVALQFLGQRLYEENKKRLAAEVK